MCRTPDQPSRRRRLAVLWTLLLALAVSACASDDVPPDDPATTPEAPQADPDDADPDTDPDEGVDEIAVFFTNLELGDEGEVHPVARTTTDDDLPSAALSALLAGPTAVERQEGYTSWFSEQTADLAHSLRITDGVAHVDFDVELPTIIPNASTSAGSLMLLAELDATLEQFDRVTSTEYALDGDVPAFYEWLQLAPPEGGAADDQEPGDAAGPDTETGTAVVQVHFSNAELGADDEVFPVERSVEVPRVLTGALRALLEGPTEAETAEGYSSWFSEQTEGLLLSVHLEDGTATVDFAAELAEVIPGASSSAGSTALLAALDATVTQFSTVDDAVYALGGDVEAFYSWLQRDVPA